VDERDCGKSHNATDGASAINVAAGELLELFEWVRERDLAALELDTEKRRHIGEEMADIIILCLNLANVLGFDAAEIVGAKLEKNRRKYPADQVRGNYRKYTELRAKGKAPDEPSGASSV